MSVIKSQIASFKPSDSSEPLKIFYLDARPAGSAKGTILLIHGFPETSHQFRHVLPLLAKAGYRVIAPDYRGAGFSSKPASGSVPGAAYTKRIVAMDLHTLLVEHAGIKEKVHVVGHDIGGMIAHAYAALFPDDCLSVIWGECPLPGSKFYEDTKGTTMLFHFVFHSLPELPEALTAGRENTALYIRHFYDKLAYRPDYLSLDDFNFYVDRFTQPGAMRAGMDLYRAFEMDAEDNRKWGKVKVPALCLMGDHSFLQNGSQSMLDDLYAEGAQLATVKDAGHWIAEESPESFVEEVTRFIGQHGTA